MSLKRRQLFVGVIDNNQWTNDKLRAYFVKQACLDDDQYVIDCQMMSYNEERFRGKSFAFLTFTHEQCVDICMKKRDDFIKDYGMTIKRLLPDTISKCERLMSTPDIVVRISKNDQLFTEENIRSYFGAYGKILDIKILDEENTGGICLITFEDFDSSDRILLDSPHYLNKQILLIHKYTQPEYICSLSQFRFIDSTKAQQIRKWYPYVRNLTDLIHPLTILYKTQLALNKFSISKQILTQKQHVDQSREEFSQLENQLNDIKQDSISLTKTNRKLEEQIEENHRKNEDFKKTILAEIEQHKKKNQSLKEKIEIINKHLIL